jgi:hypothetical protein
MVPCALELWNFAREAEQQAWLTAMSNQFVNSFRPRLLRLVDIA